MSTAYDETLDQVRRLPTRDQLQLLEELSRMVRRALKERRRHSVLDLQGLGKGVWKGVDVQEYVEGERSSWNG